jgi:site-specific DNA-methyltransferase (adenine-specific)
MGFEIKQGDALEQIRTLADASVDAIITDPPYGTTELNWDSIISIEAMWRELKRVIKPRGAIALFGSQPFTSQLIVSNFKQFKYCWIWQKSKGTGFLNAKNAPIEYHEEVAVFSAGTTANCSPNRMPYFPQGLTPTTRVRRNYNTGAVGNRPCRVDDYTQTAEGYPTTVLNYPNDGDAFHPTQKPIELMRFLVCSYTEPGETVLDFTMGSGSTGVACMIERRNFIGIELDPQYCELAEARIRRAAGEGVDIPKRQVIETELPLFG